MFAAVPPPLRLPVSIGVAALLAASLGVAAPATAATAERVAMTPELRAEIQRRVDDYRTANALTGLAVAVVTPESDGAGGVVTTFVSGLAEKDSADAVTESTQFELASESKAFTADLLAGLVDAQDASLDDLLQDYAPMGITVPVFVDPATQETTPIRLRDLATHQSGLPDTPTNAGAGCADEPGCSNFRPGYTQEMMWNGLADTTLLWKPGTNWLYSNFGFGVLGAALANHVAGIPTTTPLPYAAPAYQPAVDGAFLDFLDMADTVVETTPPPAPPTLAVPYPLSDATPPAPRYWQNNNAIVGAGGLISSAADMGIWVRAHLGYTAADAPGAVRAMAHTLRPESTITTSCSSATSCSPADFRMGLAWQLYASAGSTGVPYAFKDGGAFGFTTDTALASTLGIGVTTMTNEGAVAAPLAVPLLELVIDQRNRRPVTPTTPQLAASGADLPGLGVLIAGGVLLALTGAIAIGRGRRAR